MNEPPIIGVCDWGTRSGSKKGCARGFFSIIFLPTSHSSKNPISFDTGFVIHDFSWAILIGTGLGLPEPLRRISKFLPSSFIFTQDLLCFRSVQGTLKGFDQSLNVILQHSTERVFSSTQGVEEVELGTYIVRGDNMWVHPSSFISFSFF